MRSHRLVLCLAAAGGLLVACTSSVQVTGSPATPSAQSLAGLTGIHKIQHVIMVMQENRSFDEYFGTYPGALGIAMKNGGAAAGGTPPHCGPAACVPSPNGGCVRPFHNTADVNGGGPHGLKNAIADINGGKMNGFLQQRALAAHGLKFAQEPQC